MVDKKEKVAPEPKGKGKGKLKKGSKEAKDYMAAMRAKRGKGKKKK